jgi:protocatechuate 3,4-dioxygenase beta subunit
MPVPNSRRRALTITAGSAALGVPLAWLSTPVFANGPLRATPSQTEGPFYPLDLPDDHDADLLRHGDLVTTRGQPATVEGTLVDLDGRAVRGAVVEIWQCDAGGVYHHPGDRGRPDPAFQGFGRTVADADGRWRFRTLRPVPYSGRTPHIHVKVKLGSRELLTTQLYVEGDPGNERDFLWRRLSEEQRRLLTVPFRPAADGVRAAFPIVVRA